MNTNKLEKCCSKCKIIQTIDQFNVRTDAPNRRASHCKKCKHSRYLERMKNDVYRKNVIKNSRKWQKNNPLRAKYLIAKSNALNDKRRRTIDFDLTLDQCVKIWDQGCHYCGEVLINKSGSSLDRRDNNLGYMLSNVLPCCGDCNKVRNTILSVEEMEIAMATIIAYRKINGSTGQA
jgi:hypothetical protein